MKRANFAFILLLVFALAGCKSVATPVTLETVSAVLAATMTANQVSPASGVPTEIPFPTWLPTVEGTEAPAIATASLGGADAEVSQLSTSGWTRYAVPEDGFAISMPEGWERREPSHNVLSDFVAILNEQVDQFGFLFSAEKAQDLISEGVKLFGTDASREGVSPGPQGMLYVAKVNFGLPQAVDLFLEANINKLEEVDDPNQDVQVQRVQLANREATELRWRMIVPDLHGGTLVRDIIQYIVTEPDAIYVVSLYSPPETADYYRPTLEAMGKSFEILQ